MGQRANMVLVRGGDWKLYYDHWCANTLDVELFWGPALATEFIERRRPLENRDDWLNEIWCEGGAIVDHDRRVLLWYGGEDIMPDVPARRAFVDLMQEQWPGWDIRWAADGIVELGAYLGLGPDKFLAYDTPDPDETIRVFPDDPGFNNMLLTVRRSGVTHAARVSGDEESLELGPAQLDALVGVAWSSSLVWTGYMPTIGIHLDIDKRSTFFWCARPAERIEDRVRQGWPGWQVRWLRDQFEEHLRLASVDIRLPLRSDVELKLDLIEHLRRNCQQPASNPARELSPRIGATSVNPWTDEARGSVGSQLEKMQLLDRLQERIRSGAGR